MSQLVVSGSFYVDFPSSSSALRRRKATLQVTEVQLVVILEVQQGHEPDFFFSPPAGARLTRFLLALSRLASSGTVIPVEHFEASVSAPAGRAAEPGHRQCAYCNVL